MAPSQGRARSLVGGAEVKTIYVVIVEDRHTEPDVELFDDAGAATRWAEAHVKEQEERYRATANRTLLPSMVAAEWIYCALIENYGSVRVVPRFLHEEVPK